MTTTELLANKVQEILGNKYKVMPFGFFSQEYIKPLSTPYGMMYDVDYQAFAELQDVVPVSVMFQETTPISTDMFYRTGMLNLSFYVPIDAQSGGSFFGDYERLRKGLANGKVLVLDSVIDNEVGCTYQAFFSLAEPTTNGQIQSTGAYRRIVYTVNGNVSITDDDLYLGEDYGIEIYDGKEYVPFKNPTNITISRDVAGNTVQDVDKTLVQQPPVSRVHSISFSVVDSKSDKAVAIIRNAVIGMAEKVVETNDVAFTEAQAREVKVRLFVDGGVSIEFWATLNAQWGASGMSSVGSFMITLTRTDDNNQQG